MSHQRRSSLGERLSPRQARWAFNLWPAIRGTGARVTHIADDWSELRVEIPLSWRTRNYVGTIFGGSMYAGVDPFLMLLAMRRLGDAYVVWDKAATIRFRRPARETLHATFTVDDATVDALRARASVEGSFDWTSTVELVDRAGEVHATVEKVLYVATAEADAERRAARS